MFEIIFPLNFPLWIDAPYPEKSVQRLSDRFPGGTENVHLELIVNVFNVNDGYNPELLQKSRDLGEYAQFIATVRKFVEKYPNDKARAFDLAIDDCIRHTILCPFLQNHSSEVRNMLLTEWNWDDAREVWHEEGFAQGEQAGREEANLETARKLKAMGMPIEQIAKATGIPLENIEKL